MTRILVQRGSGSSSNQGRSSAAASSSASRPETQVSSTSQIGSPSKDEEIFEEFPEHFFVNEFLEHCGNNDKKRNKSDELFLDSSHGNKCERLSDEIGDNQQLSNDEGVASGISTIRLGGIKISERPSVDSDCKGDSSPESVRPQPPPPPVPPPKPSCTSFSPRRSLSGGSSSPWMGSTRRSVGWPVVSTRTSPSRSRPSSPRSHGESEGYNSADEQNSGFVSSYDDVERERQFEIDIRCSKGLEVRKMMEDGNCLFHAVADQVYGDSEAYDLVRQMCIDYMERERDHFSQFITEGFTSYCKRKRRDKVYGNNVEIQAMSEMYNRPIHIYSYSTEPINIFHGSYNTDVPPIRLSYHRGNHYNSLVDPRRLTIGAGLGFSSLRGTNVDKDQVKTAIKAQQDQQIDNALIAEGRFYSDLELTEKEIERMVMEASRAEYIANDRLKQQVGHKESSTSGAEPSSSGASGETKVEGPRERGVRDSVLSNGMQIVLSMGFSYLQVIEAYSLIGDDVDSMVCYLLETGSSSNRRKGKATE